jgi:PAS domain S-box-containing protein
MPLSQTPPSSAIRTLLHTADWTRSPLGDPAGWSPTLRASFDLMINAPVQIVMFWGKGYVALYNDTYMPTIGDKHPRAFGRPAEENWAELWDDLKPLLDQVWEQGEPVLARDRPFSITRHGHPETVTFDISYSAVREHDGKVAGVICIVEETTDRTNYERRLRESEERLKAITNSIDQMIWSTRPDGYHDYYNDRWYEYTGVPHGSTDGASWNGMFHPDDQERALSSWRHSLATGGPYQVEYRLRHRSGDYRWVIGRAHAVVDAGGKITRWYGSCTDIHEMKIAEIQRSAVIELQEQIRELDNPDEIAFAAARTLGMLLEASRAGYGTIDLDTETVTIAKDWTAEGVKSLRGIVRLRDYGTFVDDLKRGETVVFTDAERDSRTQGKIHALREASALSIVNIPIRERNGLVAMLFINNATPREWLPEELRFIREVAERTRQAVERRRAETELKQLTVSLEQQVDERTADLMKAEAQLRQSQKMEAIGQLTGGIAHDFNNNLAVIMGGLNLLKRRLERGETDVERFISGAMEGAQRAASLTQRLLAFSRQQPLSPETVDSNRMLVGMSELLRRTLGEHIRVETVLAAGLWKVRTDVAQLENAMLNLAVNARDAMADGGKLTIETANTHVDEAYGREYDLTTGQYVMIAISDTGTGMSREVAAKAFDPFFTTKGVGKGTGLGLSQVFGFVRQTGGHIKIYSEVSVGTTIKIYLPRLYGGAATVDHARNTQQEMPRGGAETILLVEDEERVRKFTEEALADLGYDVTSAGGGPEALQLLESGRTFDLLLTDIVMPDMNGRKLADLARRQVPGIKVIYATGYTRNAVVHNGMLDPGTNLLQKPFSLDQLARKVRTVLDGSQ